MLRRLATLVILAAFALACLRQVVENNDQDFFIYRGGAGLAWRGESPYRAGAVRPLVEEQFPGSTELAENCGFFLAPPALVLFAPFALLPWPAAKLAWAVASFVAGLSALRLGRLFTDVPEEHRATVRVIVAAAVLLNPVTVGGLIVGQTTLIVVGCVVGGLIAFDARRPVVGSFLWAVPFVKPHLALPLLPLAWYLGGWKRAAGVVGWVVGLSLAACVVAGSPSLLTDYAEHLRAGHKTVRFNRIEENPQITSWNRVLIAAGGPAVELSAATTLAGYAACAGLVLARVRLAGRRPSPEWALAVAAVGALVCCQLLPYELALLALAAPFVVSLWNAGRTRDVAAFAVLLLAVSAPYLLVLPAAQAMASAGSVRFAVLLISYRSICVALIVALLLVRGWPADASAKGR